MCAVGVNEVLWVFAILCVSAAWFRSRIRLVKSTAENSPIQGNPEDPIVMYGKLASSLLSIHKTIKVACCSLHAVQQPCAQHSSWQWPDLKNIHLAKVNVSIAVAGKLQCNFAATQG